MYFCSYSFVINILEGNRNEGRDGILRPNGGKLEWFTKYMRRLSKGKINRKKEQKYMRGKNVRQECFKYACKEDRCYKGLWNSQ